MKATHSYHTVYQFIAAWFKRYPRALSVRCYLYKIHDSPRPLHVVDPTVIELQALHSEDHADAWNISNRRRAAESLDAALDALSIDSESDGSTNAEEEARMLFPSPREMVEALFPGSDPHSECEGSARDGELEQEALVDDPCPSTPSLDAEGNASDVGSALPDKAPSESHSSTDSSSSSSSASASSSSSSSSSSDSSKSNAMDEEAADALEDDLALRTIALDVVKTPYGDIKFYRSGDFKGFCTNPAHVRCEIKRTHRAGRKSAQGRPLGLIYAWLQGGHLPEYPTRAEHHSMCKPDYDERFAARLELQVMEGSADMFRHERPQLPIEEGPEPRGMP